MAQPPAGPSTRDQDLAAFHAAIERGDPLEASRLADAWPESTAPEDVFAFRFLRRFDAGDFAAARALAGRGLQRHPGSALLAFQLGRALEALGDPLAARDALRQAHANDPALVWALFWLADQDEALHDDEAASANSLRALAAAEGAGILAAAAGLPDYVTERIARAQARATAARGQALERALSPARSRHGPAAIERVQRAFDAYLGRTQREPAHALQKPTFLLVPDLPARPWLERGEFPFLAGIEAEADAIRDELLGVLAGDAGLPPYVDMPDSAPGAAIFRELNRSPRWGAFHFHRHGERIEANCRRCPRTAAALEAMPLIRIPGHSPEAMFSVLKPHTHIPPHAGVINGRLTVHLPLVVPERCGGLAVAREVRPWQAGRCLVFDDSFIHEAINQSDETRVVLIFDLWHPALTGPEREALAAGIAAIGDLNRRVGAGA